MTEINTTTPLPQVTALQLRVAVLEATPGLEMSMVNCGLDPGVPEMRCESATTGRGCIAGGT